LGGWGRRGGRQLAAACPLEPDNSGNEDDGKNDAENDELHDRPSNQSPVDCDVVGLLSGS